jgi:SAM-dependent methyltransferase
VSTFQEDRTEGAAGFADHYSGVARDYARFRPRYPEALFDYVADVAPGRTAVWDCATGSGQAALPLAARFERVVATDASREQLARMPHHARVAAVCAAAEQAPLRETWADAVTVAQALHWLDLPRFHQEVRRVLRAGGVLVVWSYGAPRLEAAALQRGFAEFCEGTVAPHWPPERRHVDCGYRTLAPPAGMVAVAAPAPAMSASLSLDALLGYVGTWSAVRRCRAATGRDPVPALRERLRRAGWHDAESAVTVTWPLTVLAWRREGRR